MINPLNYEPCNVKPEPLRLYVFHKDDVKVSTNERGETVVRLKKRGKFKGRYYHRPILLADPCEGATEEQLSQVERLRIQDEPPTPQAIKMKFTLTFKNDKNDGSHNS